MRTTCPSIEIPERRHAETKYRRNAGALNILTIAAANKVASGKNEMQARIKTSVSLIVDHNS